MRFLLAAVLGTALFLVSVSAQSRSDDALVDSILDKPAVNWGQAAWLVGRALGTFDESTTPEQAATRASGAGWGPRNLAPDGEIDLSAYSQLLVRALEIPGGVLYGLFPSPRYAVRELVFRKVVPGSLSPDSPVDGRVAFLYLQNAQAWKESQR